jgi:hypothetical protein
MSMKSTTHYWELEGEKEHLVVRHLSWISEQFLEFLGTIISPTKQICFFQKPVSVIRGDKNM